MRKLAGKLAVALALAVIAMPLTAYAQGAGGAAQVRSGRGGGGVHVGGGGGAILRRDVRCAAGNAVLYPACRRTKFYVACRHAKFYAACRHTKLCPAIDAIWDSAPRHDVQPLGPAHATPAHGNAAEYRAAHVAQDHRRAHQCAPPQRHRRHHAASGAARPLRLAFRGADGQSFRECRRAPGLAARPARRLRAVVRPGVLALRLFRHFRLRVLAQRL